VRQRGKGGVLAPEIPPSIRLCTHTSNDWSNGAEYTDAVPVLESYGLKARRVEHPTLSDLVNAVKANNLAMVTVSMGTSWHAVLVVNIAIDPTGGTDHVFWVLDPWPNKTEAFGARKGPVVMSSQRFLSRWMTNDEIVTIK
jgi:hypothetical protein